MMSSEGDRSREGTLGYVLGELVAGVLEFKIDGEKEPKGTAPLPQSATDAAPGEVLGVVRSDGSNGSGW
jgi:hypothetical protein